MNYKRPLTEEVPKEIRLQVYKKALELIENWKYYQIPEQGSLIFPELCFLLPVILYEEEHFLLRKKEWLSVETKLGFTELNNKFFKEIEGPMLQIEKIEIRKKYLKEFIQQLEN